MGVTTLKLMIQIFFRVNFWEIIFGYLNLFIDLQIFTSIIPDDPTSKWLSQQSWNEARSGLTLENLSNKIEFLLFFLCQSLKLDTVALRSASVALECPKVLNINHVIANLIFPSINMLSNFFSLYPLIDSLLPHDHGVSESFLGPKWQADLCGYRSLQGE